MAPDPNKFVITLVGGGEIVCILDNYVRWGGEEYH